MVNAFVMLIIVALLQAAHSFMILPSLSLYRSTIPSKFEKLVAMRASLVQDTCTSIAGLGASWAWLKLWITLAKSGKMDPKLSRKIIHTAVVPVVQLGRLYLAGTSTSSLQGATAGNNDGIVDAISRTGSTNEALGGPLIYTVVLLLSTLIFFRESPIGTIATIQMAAGDGMADIIGRRWGRVKWPFSESKSIAGTLAFVAAAFIVCCAVLGWFNIAGSIAFDVATLWPQLLFISVLCAAVELVPVGDDNISVPVVGAAAAALLF